MNEPIEIIETQNLCRTGVRKRKWRKIILNKLNLEEKRKRFLRSSIIWYISGVVVAWVVFFGVERCDIAKYKNLFSHTLWIPKNIYKCEKKMTFFFYSFCLRYSLHDRWARHTQRVERTYIEREENCVFSDEIIWYWITWNYRYRLNKRTEKRGEEKRREKIGLDCLGWNIDLSYLIS